ncbi:MAG: hypothetical protein RLY71_2458 [Pseudomonadota bacterium]|jgi:Na+/H+ antiporter NhaD/arsenite permease-like protein
MTMTCTRCARTLLVGLTLTALPIWSHANEIDGAGLSGWWSVPFAGVLLSIALCPLLMLHVWHHHYGKITAAWVLAFLLPFAVFHGFGAAASTLAHATVAEYIPFIILLTALFTVAGGIYVRGNFHGSPTFNALLMLIGAALASLMGTTGASMLLIRPLIRANDNRRHAAHVVIFFIFIVSNAGGSLTPLGDPPLFLGFLKGVDFMWPLRHIFTETLFLVGCLLLIFWCIDTWFYRREGIVVPDPTPDDHVFGIVGSVNLVLLAGVVGLVLMSGLWKPDFAVEVAGARIGLEQILRDVALLGVIGLSLWLTPHEAREENQFNWEPMKEVAKLFAGIFVTIAPVLAMLKAGADGAFASVVALVTSPQGEPIPMMYFWAAGLLSSFLDNAPTYLVFFNLAGGDPQIMMTTLAPVLAAISAGSVFMGANSYIGNAPNLMVKAIAEERGVQMPSFFGYIAWSVLILVPLFVLMTVIWFD